MHLVSQAEADEIQHQILQSECKRWHKEREWRVTASKFGEIVKATQRRDMELLCENIPNPPDLRCAAVLHGQTYEKQAIEAFTTLMGIKTENCGLYVNPDYPHLGATPDALIHPDGLVEVKCPFKGRNSAIEIMSPTFKSDFPFLKIENGRIVLNHNHNYYYQIQGQMGIARKSYCYFIAYTFEDIFIEKIFFDEKIFTGTMVPALSDFYERLWRPFLAFPFLAG